MKTGRNTRTRQQAILRHLHQNGRATVEELAGRFETTPQTIRKDLNILAGAGRVMRFHGGASLLAGSEYTGYEVRKQIAREQKERIGRAAAALVPNNTAVILNAGTTTAEVARRLENHSGLKLVTDNLEIANELRHMAGIEVMVPGGVIRASDGAILGETAVEFIRQFRADIAIVGCAAIASDGALLDFDLREAVVARAILAVSRNVILAVDSSKFERMAPVCIGHLNQLRSLVTDRGCPAELRDLCRAEGVDLVIAD
ncbi:DeoR/GlpR family DNA-binding transcription regulator [Tropicimonas sp. IMCC6043]|uniref:DeoR/GlpR family DNA-binding transcription regulator n=1 Tax=Tropicimonas sp. IMCC6043 TaxID=2510645 RepID=UPI00101BD3B2|nr:DeoR/GlpR family DNA-binding transcription regulator [Tropicimonas sp. IMCC6043]RYH08621.1 DeoR/GlpR transcriptional regulator [Tropicimonas sp. IMCC6043]